MENIFHLGLLLKNKKTLYIDALEDINFTIKSGDIVGLYGPNGSGKTTLLRTIAGGYHPIKGNIEKYGFINNLIETGIAIDHESTGYDNIKNKLLFLGYPTDLIEKKRSNIIEFSELGDAIYNRKNIFNWDAYEAYVFYSDIYSCRYFITR